MTGWYRVFFMFLVVFLSLAPLRAYSQCTNDIECKGTRICVNGECVDAPPKAPGPKPCAKDGECTGSQVCQGGICGEPKQMPAQNPQATDSLQTRGEPAKQVTHSLHFPDSTHPPYKPPEGIIRAGASIGSGNAGGGSGLKYGFYLGFKPWKHVGFEGYYTNDKATTNIDERYDGKPVNSVGGSVFYTQQVFDFSRLSCSVGAEGGAGAHYFNGAIGNDAAIIIDAPIDQGLCFRFEIGPYAQVGPVRIVADFTWDLPATHSASDPIDKISGSFSFQAKAIFLIK
jgi:hypothetical protein